LCLISYSLKDTSIMIAEGRGIDIYLILMESKHDL
jgi:hypothetical protein